MSLTETIQIQATPEFRRQLETEAARLNLSISAYILYLHARMAPVRTLGGSTATSRNFSADMAK